MALITCSECGSEVSDKAAVCMRCGAPVAKPTSQAIPVAVQPKPASPVWKWLFGVPVALFVIAVLYGLSVPEYEREANAARRVCRDMVVRGSTTFDECDRIHASAIAHGRAVSNPRPSASVPGVSAADIAAALEDGRRRAGEPNTPTEWPKPPASLSGGK
jgi:hypothetical protein